MLPQIIVYFAIDFFSCIPFWRIAFTTIVDNTSAPIASNVKNPSRNPLKMEFLYSHQQVLQMFLVKELLLLP